MVNKNERRTGYLLSTYNEIHSDFRVPFNADYNNFHLYGAIEIDTGASISIISTRSLEMDEEECLLEKEKAVDEYRAGNLEICIVHGVENANDSITRDIFDSMSREEQIKCDAVVFCYTLDNCILGSYEVGSNIPFWLSFDNHNSVLLGMDFLRYFDFHIGKSVALNPDVYGKVLFLGCLQDNISESYERAMDFCFHRATNYEEILDDNRVDVNMLKSAYIAGYWSRSINIRRIKNKIKKIIQ